MTINSLIKEKGKQMGNKKCSKPTQDRIDHASSSVCSDTWTGNAFGIYNRIKLVLDEFLKEVQTVYNVTQYEVTGNGVVDDAPAIQALIDLGHDIPCEFRSKEGTCSLCVLPSYPPNGTVYEAECTWRNPCSLEIPDESH